MTASPPPDAIPAWAGRCASCTWARPIRSDRGSVFVLCERSRSDMRYRRYPMLPVVRCEGFAAVADGA